MVTELLGIGIVAGEKMGELWRWIGKTWELNLAIHAAFAKPGIVHPRYTKTLIPPMQCTTGRTWNVHSTQIRNGPTNIEGLTCNGNWNGQDRRWW